MNLVATPAEKQVTGWPLPIYSTGFEGLLHLDSSSWGPKDLISPMNQICADNAPLSSLGNISREAWFETPNSNFLGDENAYSPSDYDFQYNAASHTYQKECCCIPGTYSFENIDLSHDRINGNNIERDNLSRNSHIMVQPFYQARPSNPSSGAERTSSQSECLPNPTSGLENESISVATRRGRAHNTAEKRYRDSIDLKFLRLEDVLTPNHGSQNNTDMTPHKMSKRMNRAAILENAHDVILNLRAEIKSTEGKFESLREATFPDTYKFTLRKY